MQLIYWYAQQLLRHLQGHKQTITDPGQGVDEHAEQTWLDDHRADECFIVNENICDHLQIPAMVSRQSKPKRLMLSVLYQKRLSSSLQLIHTLIYLITQSRGQELIYIFNSSFHPWQRKKRGERMAEEREDERRKETLQCRWIPLKKKTEEIMDFTEIKKWINAVHS